MLFGSANTDTELKQAGSSNLTSSEDSAAVREQEQQVGDHGTFHKIKEEAWDPEFDSLVKHNEVDMLRNKVKQEEDEAEDKLPEGDMERTCLTADTSEYELPILKQWTEGTKCNDVPHQPSEVLNREGIIYPSMAGLLCCINAHRAHALGFVVCIVSVAAGQFCCWIEK